MYKLVTATLGILCFWGVISLLGVEVTSVIGFFAFVGEIILVLLGLIFLAITIAPSPLTEEQQKEAVESELLYLSQAAIDHGYVKVDSGQVRTSPYSRPRTIHHTRIGFFGGSYSVGETHDRIDDTWVTISGAGKPNGFFLSDADMNIYSYFKEIKFETLLILQNRIDSSIIIFKAK